MVRSACFSNFIGQDIKKIDVYTDGVLYIEFIMHKECVSTEEEMN